MRETFFMNLPGRFSRPNLEKNNHPYYYLELPEEAAGQSISLPIKPQIFEFQKRSETIALKVGNQMSSEFAWPELFYRRVVLCLLGGALFAIMACLVRAL